MENRKIYLTNMRSDFFLQRKENDRPKDFSGKIILNSKGFFFKYCIRDRYYKNN
jgi:hypothetical protein